VNKYSIGFNEEMSWEKDNGFPRVNTSILSVLIN
jgi:hypothetical protein